MIRKFVAGVLVLSLICAGGAPVFADDYEVPLTPQPDPPQADAAKNKLIIPSDMKVGGVYTISAIGDRQGYASKPTAIGETIWMPHRISVDGHGDFWDSFGSVEYEHTRYHWHGNWLTNHVIYYKISPAPALSFRPLYAGTYKISVQYDRYAYEAVKESYNNTTNDWDLTRCTASHRSWNSIDFKEETVTVNITDYAPGFFKTVTLNPNGGKLANRKLKVRPYKVLPYMNESRVEYTYPSLPTPKRTNYKYLGWYAKKKGGKAVTKGKPFAAEIDHTLYAHWVKRPKGKDRTITKAEYKWIDKSMTIKEVKRVIGGNYYSKGKSYKSYKGKKVREYIWKGKNGGKATIMISKDTGEVVSKSKSGLK
jgi:uncharacterized repeat protein (TIGR02543 family)